MADQTQVIIVAMVITLSVVLLIELRFMRERRKRKGAEVELPDRAHNALLTTKAIADALTRGGVRSPEAEDLIREAGDALGQRQYRVAIELAEKAKGILRNAKLRQHHEGDLAKVDAIGAKADADEITTKERLMKELPANYAPSKFSMGLARDDIAAAKARGRDTSRAERHLADAQASFDAEDYDAALRNAVRARRVFGGASPPAESAPVAAEVTKPVAPPSAKARTCPSCGAPVPADDAFCRKCGVEVPRARTCPSCGADVADADAFCRKCGAKVN